MRRERQSKALRIMAEIVAAHEGGIHGSAVVDELERRMPPEGDERGHYASHPDRTKLGVQAMFVSTGLVKAGWIRKVNGTWSITDEGRSALTRYADPGQFHAELHRLYHQWRKGEMELGDFDETSSNAAPAVIAFETAQEQARADIQEYLGKLPPPIFEELIEHLLRAMGYYVPYRTTGGADGGIDIVAYEDPLGAKGARIKVQAKRTQGTIGRPVIQELLGSLAEGETGLIVALSGFSKDAEQFARAHQTRRITLIDGEQLVELWIKNYVNIPEDGRQILRLSPVYFLHQN